MTVEQEKLKRHIRRDMADGLTSCGRRAREGDMKLSRFFRELEVLPRGSARRVQFVGSMCASCTRIHLSVGRD